MKRKFSQNLFHSTRLKLDLIASLFLIFVLFGFSFLVYKLLTVDLIYQISPIFENSDINLYVNVEKLFSDFRWQTVFLLIVLDIFIFGISLFFFDKMVKKMLEPIEYLSNLQKKFASNLSHELRTPLAIINMNSEIMMDKIEKEEKISQNKFLGDMKSGTLNILEETKGVTTLIDDLLFEARIKYGENKIENITLLDIKKKVEKVLDNFKKANEENIELIVEDKINKDEEHKKIKANRLHMMRILNNLISNSFKYTQKGKIRIILDKYKYNKKEYLKIGVHDTGMGIKREDIKNVKERFYRGDNVESIVSGTGVGLSIVNDLVKDYGWKMEIESEENMWTSVEISRIPVL